MAEENETAPAPAPKPAAKKPAAKKKAPKPEVTPAMENKADLRAAAQADRVADMALADGRTDLPDPQDILKDEDEVQAAFSHDVSDTEITEFSAERADGDVGVFSGVVGAVPQPASVHRMPFNAS